MNICSTRSYNEWWARHTLQGYKYPHNYDGTKVEEDLSAGRTQGKEILHAAGKEKMRKPQNKIWEVEISFPYSILAPSLFLK